MDAQTMLAALQAAGLPVTGVCVLDVLDPATWTFQPATLTAAELAQARLLVQGQIEIALNPPIPVIPATPTIEQVIAWQAQKLGIPVDQAFDEIVLQPTAYVRGTKS